MLRAIRYSTEAPPNGSAPNASPPDGYKDRVLKLIPSEVVAFFLFCKGVIPDSDSWYLFAVFVAGLVATPLYLVRSTANDAIRPKPKQVLLTSLAFVVWVFAIGNPLASFSVALPTLVPPLLLATFTLFSPLL
jgi:hypothetical protein